MTEAEARALCERLGSEHPERHSHRWLLRQGEDGWTVVKVPLPEGRGLRPLTTGSEARPRPPHPDDPRPAHVQNVPGAWG
jgi:hypothetical protein